MKSKIAYLIEPTPFWQELNWPELPAQSVGSPGGLYAGLNKDLSPAQTRPNPRPGTQVKLLQSSQGPYYMLKTTAGQYLKLLERDYFLWTLMDGRRDLTQLALAYQQAYKSFALERILGLVTKLRQNGFLVEQPVDLYSTVHRRLKDTRLRRVISFVQRSIFMLEIPLHGLNRPMAWLYRKIGRLAFTSLFLWSSLLIILSGLGAFVSNASSGRYYILSFDQGLGFNLLWLALGYLLSVMLHELAHALCLKHFGGEVPNGGFLLYYAMPAFFINTTDVWMYERRARILTSWAGPHTNFLIGGLCSLILWLAPTNPASAVLFSVAFMCYMGAVFNLNVLLELDGYYMLMDWLEVPRLRSRAMLFIRRQLWSKLWRREKFNREEQILGWFGGLAILYTGLTLLYIFWSLQTQLARWVSQALGQSDLPSKLFFGLGSLLLLALLGFMLGPLLWHGLSEVGRRAVQKVLSGEGPLAVALLLSLGLGLAVQRGFGFSREVGLGLVVLITGWLWVKIWWRPGPVYGPLRGLSLSVAAVTLAWFWQLIWEGQARPAPLSLAGLTLAGVCLLVVALRLIGYLDLDSLGQPARWLLGSLALASLVAGLPGAVWQSRQNGDWLECLLAGFTPGVACLTLALVLTLLLQQRHTRFRMGHGAFALSSLGLLSLSLGYTWAHSHGSGASQGWLAELTRPAGLGWLILAWGWFSSAALYGLAFRLSLQLPARQAVQNDLSDGVRLYRATYYLLGTALKLVETAFGSGTARQVANGLNLAAATGDWPLRVDNALQVNGLEKAESRAEGDLNDTGKRLAQMLDRLRELMVQSCGEAYTQATFGRAIDSLYWEERELTEEHVLIFSEGPSWFSASRKEAAAETQQLLAAIPLFVECDPAQLQSLARACYERKCRPGETIMREGEVGDSFFIVKSGRVSVWQHQEGAGELQVNSHGRGNYFGELALLHAAPRNATCRADTAVTLLGWRKPDFDRLARRHFELAANMEKLYRRLSLLQKIPLFKETPLSALKDIVSRLQLREIGPGETIIRQGEPGETFYVIEQGEVEILVETANSPVRPVDRRGPGEFFGEVALLMDTPRTATVRAIGQVWLLELWRTDFLNLVTRDDGIKRNLERVASRRYLSLKSRAVVNY